MDVPPLAAEVDAPHNAQEDEDEDEDEEEEKDMTPKQIRYWLLVEKVNSVFGLFETLKRGRLSAVARHMGFPRSTVHGWLVASLVGRSRPATLCPGNRP
jgi:hypothetical protein